MKTEVIIIFNNAKLMSVLSKALQHIMYSMENEASKLVPVDTGLLKNRIEVRKITDFKWVLQAKTNYAAFVEGGTGQRGASSMPLPNVKYGSDLGQSAQPYMRPALQLGVMIAPKVFDYYLKAA